MVIIHIIGAPKGEEEENKRKAKSEEIMAKNLSDQNYKATYNKTNAMNPKQDK